MPPPRGLLALALVWIAVAFAATVGTRVPIQPTSSSYTPGVRTLLELMAIGGVTLWPIGRLATARGVWSPGRVALDLVTLLVVLQVVLWPMQLVTYWPPLRGAAMDIMISGWLAAAGGVLACGLGSSGWRRTAWGLAWLLLVGTGPLLDVLGVAPPAPELGGPAVALLTIAPLLPGTMAPGTWPIAIWPWIPALFLWAAALRRAAHPPRMVAPAANPG